jgi:hypothetical protein
MLRPAMGRKNYQNYEYFCRKANPMKITFFKRPQARKFNYKPMYYDQEKEELEERKKQLGLINEGDAGERLRSEIRRRWHTERTEKDNSYKVIRTIIYLFILTLSIYLIFFTDFINNLVSIFVRK